MAIDTYNIEKDIQNVTLRDMSISEYEAQYVMLGSQYVAAEIEKQALTESINKNLDKEMAEKVMKDADMMIEAHASRNTTEQMKETLKAYNCDKNVVLCSTVEAENNLDEGYPVFAINKNGEMVALSDKMSILQAEKNGDLLATSQFAIDDMMESILE